MRRYVIVLILFGFIAGCVLHSDLLLRGNDIAEKCEIVAASVGLPKTEVVSIARETGKQLNLQVVTVVESKDGSIMICLRDCLKRLNKDDRKHLLHSVRRIRTDRAEESLSVWMERS